MNTREVATYLGTTPKILRRFLRHPMSDFIPVGSGGRYEFTAEVIPTLQEQFTVWLNTERAPVSRSKAKAQGDEESETPAVLPDIRKAHVRKAVHEEANRRAAALDELLLAAGQHISQWRGHGRGVTR